MGTDLFASFFALNLCRVGRQNGGFFMTTKAAYKSRPRQKRNFREWWEDVGVTYAMLAPNLILFAVFVIYPILWTMRFMLFDYNGITQAEFTGLQNFTRAIHDQYWWNAVLNTLKIAGLKLCEMYNRQYGTDYISVMPCNIYGIGDNFDPVRSHVVAALIRKVHEAKMSHSKSITVWGTGNARRELMFNEDLADACLFLFENYSGNEFFNVGTGTDVSMEVNLCGELDE